MIKEVISQGIDRLSPLLAKTGGVVGTAVRPKFNSVQSVVEAHFRDYSDPDHPCRKTLSLALEILAGKPAKILETGSSAWGTNSSLLFDSYVNSFGGHFSTVDIRITPTIALRRRCTANTSLFCDDSVSFLRRHTRNLESADLVYLDSWDVDWSSPLASAIHGLHEFLVMLPTMRTGSLLLIDDSPRDAQIMSGVNVHELDGFERFVSEYGMAPGKGALVKNYLSKNGIGKEIAHDYQLLWQF